MIREYIDILESFKEHHISARLEQINTKIFEALLSDKFNPEIASYFIHTNDQGLRAVQINKEGPPFTNYSLDPDNVSQVKKLINALYFARLALIDLEQINPIGLTLTSINDFFRLYSKTIDKAYEASYLLTHMDVSVQDIFRNELQLILPALIKLRAIIQPSDEQKRRLTQQIEAYPLSHTIGTITGTALEQMKPSNGVLDYGFLTQFGSILPSYIEKATQYIEQYSKNLVEIEPSLNNERITELKATGLKLLADLEHLKGGHFFISLKFLKYIHIVRHIITLGMSAIEQMGNLSASSQDLIRYNLSQLKYEVLPSLFSLVDKIEVESMLKPGTLSVPLMAKIEPFYAAIIHYASKPVDFQSKGEELLSIEDSHFLSLRLEAGYKRIRDAEKELFKIKKVQEAYTSLINLLNEEPWRELTLNNLPEDLKITLRGHYKIINVHLLNLNPELSELIISNLEGQKSWGSYFQSWGSNLQSWATFLSTPTQWRQQQRAINEVSQIVNQLQPLDGFIKKRIASLNFHVSLNKQLIKSVQEQTNLMLYPYSENNYAPLSSVSYSTAPSEGAPSELERTEQSIVAPVEVANREQNAAITSPPARIRHSVFIIDESQALAESKSAHSDIQYKMNGENNLVENQQQLRADEALSLARWYRDKCDKFNVARNAYEQLIKVPELLQSPFNPSMLNQKTKELCRKLYNQFQAYFINGMPQELRADGLTFDKFLVQSLSNNSRDRGNLEPNLFITMNEHFQQFFSIIDLLWRKKSRDYEALAVRLFAKEHNEQEMIHYVPTNRQHYLIKETHYSKFIKDFRAELEQVLLVFNPSMLQELKIQPDGIPFPELSRHPLMSQGKQVRAIKQLFNAVYHIEHILRQLENLNDKSKKSQYVFYLIQAYGQINEIVKISKSLASDPHFELIGQELFEKIQYAWATIQEHIEPYQTAHDTIPIKGVVQYNALWYTLNAFFILPEHIKSIEHHAKISPEMLIALQKSAKKSTLGIEAIINNAHSYFRLFLQTPNMIQLYFNLKKKLGTFINTTHDAATRHLNEFNLQLFLPMLIEADHMEDSLCLKPGTLSEPLRIMLREYYKGLLAPLKLHAKQHLELIGDEQVLEQRIIDNEQQIERLSKDLQELRQRFAPINKLNILIQRHNEYHKNTDCPNIISTAYSNALPLLIDLQAELSLSPEKHNADSVALDNRLNENNEPKLEQIGALVHASHAHFKGLEKTYTLQIDTHNGKKTYLNELRRTQKSEQVHFINEYTTESFDRQIDVLANRYVGLQHADEEYTKNLKDHLLAFKEDMMSTAKTTDDINLSIEEQLKEKITAYQQQHLIAYHQLEAIRIALAQFGSYFRKSDEAIKQGRSLFENQITLDEKTTQIRALLKTAKNQELLIQERINQITRAVRENPNFTRIILQYKEVDYLSFAYLGQCILALLEALHLYKPSRAACLSELETAVKTPPKIEHLNKRFGLFTKQKHPIEAAPLPEEITTNSPVPSN